MPPVAPELTPKERQLQVELEKHVGELSQKLGERTVAQPWELAGAADYVAGQWESMGFTIERQGYDVEEVVAQNLEASVSGGELGRQSIIVGAHYDTPAGHRGATGVAALLVLSKLFREQTPKRRVRFVAYALGEAPHFGQESMGSLRHARAVAASGEEVFAMISLDSLGRFNDSAGSQRSLSGIDVPLPNAGNFLLVLGTENAQTVLSTLVSSCPARAGVELIARTYRAGAGQEHSPLTADAWAYGRAGMPAVVVSDTKALRDGPPADRLEDLDFVRLTRSVGCLAKGLEQLASGPATGAEAPKRGG
jgi:hypothetical protein